MKEYKKRILFIGIPDMAFICLDACLSVGVNIVGVMGPKPDHHMYNIFKKFVEDRKLNFIPYTDLHSEQLLNTIKDLDVDLAAVSSFNYKIPKKLLNATKDGFINLHPSLLPLYRGANPYSRTIINGELKTGVTLHFMDEEFDKGDIILQYPCEIAHDETMGTLFNKTNDICVKLLLATLKEYEERPLPRIKQKDGEYPIANNIGDAETHINYNNSAVNIERLVRGLNPFIVAKTYFRGVHIRVLKVEVVKGSYPESKYGEIVDIVDDKIIIKTVENCISLELMQFGSYFYGTSKDFIRFIEPKIGEVFL